MTHCICMVHFLQLTVSVALALLLCLSLTFCSFANKQLVFFGPCLSVQWMLETQLLDILMWSVRRVLLICATLSSRWWNTLKTVLTCKTTRINLNWGYREKPSVCCAAIVQSVCDWWVVCWKKKRQRLWIVTHAEGVWWQPNFDNGNSKKLTAPQSWEACGRSVVVSASDGHSMWLALGSPTVGDLNSWKWGSVQRSFSHRW